MRIGQRRLVGRRGTPDVVARLLSNAPAAGERESDQHDPAPQERRREGWAMRSECTGKAESCTSSPSSRAPPPRERSRARRRRNPYRAWAARGGQRPAPSAETPRPAPCGPRPPAPPARRAHSLGQRPQQRGEHLGAADQVERHRHAGHAGERADLALDVVHDAAELAEIAAAALVEIAHGRAGRGHTVIGESPGHRGPDLALVGVAALLDRLALRRRNDGSAACGLGRIASRWRRESQRPCSTQLTLSSSRSPAGTRTELSKRRFCWAPSTSSPS